MMTDGVLDALPLEREEETMKEIIMDIKEALQRKSAESERFWDTAITGQGTT